MADHFETTQVVKKMELEPTDGIYEVDRIVGMTKKKGEMRYKVRWKGYSPEYDTWETEATLHSCNDLINSFKASRNKQNQIKSQERESQSPRGNSLKKKPSFTYLDVETTLKDTFWKDLEEGRVNVFATDLYSRVKATGRCTRDIKNNDTNSDHVMDDKVIYDKDKINAPNTRRKSKGRVTPMYTSVVHPNQSKNSICGLHVEGIHNEVQSDILHSSRTDSTLTATSLHTHDDIKYNNNDTVCTTDIVTAGAHVKCEIVDSCTILTSNTNHTSMKNGKRNTHLRDTKKCRKKRKISICSWPSVDSGIANSSPSSVSNSGSPGDMDIDTNGVASYVQQKTTAGEHLDYFFERCSRPSDSNGHVSINSPEVTKSLDISKDSHLLITDGLHVDAEFNGHQSLPNISPTCNQTELSPGEVKSAVLRGDFEMVKRALDNQYSGRLNTVDPTGMVLLMVAAQSGYVDIVDLLISHGSCVNAQQKNGTTALMLACEQGHIATVVFLVSAGASINLQQSSGETALMKAIRRGHVDIAEFLLLAGANYNVRALNGNSALSLSKHSPSRSMETLLTNHRERVNLEFNKQVTMALKNTAHIISGLFPIQCFPLSEGPQFSVTFSHEIYAQESDYSFMLFLGHTRMSEAEITCRLYGPSAIVSVTLNDVPQYPVSKDCAFVLSISPLKYGKNDLVINTVTATTSKTKLLVCAYKAKVADHQV